MLKRVSKAEHLKINGIGIRNSMDNKKTANILKELLTNICKMFPDTKEFIHNSLLKIC